MQRRFGQRFKLRLANSKLKELLEVQHHDGRRIPPPPQIYIPPPAPAPAPTTQVPTQALLQVTDLQQEMFRRYKENRDFEQATGSYRV